VEDVRALAASFDYPVVVKPVVGHVWRERFRGEKAIRVDAPEALTRLYQQLLLAGQRAVMQSLITGPNSNHCKVCAYVDRTGHARAVICLRKIRQYPVDFGVGTLMESVDEPGLSALGLRFLRALDWRGPASIEFKRDGRDGGWKLIELNPRLWQQNALAGACGMDFPVLQYLDATGTAPTMSCYRSRVRWLDEFRDPRSARAHVRAGALTVAQWARSLARVRVCALWAADDPAPFMAAARHHVVRASQRLARVRGAPLPSARPSPSVRGPIVN
jgi:predicted ATP-grasp superfamily ATP-dependent carboligase